MAERWGNAIFTSPFGGQYGNSYEWKERGWNGGWKSVRRVNVYS